ncbi:shikimate kinase [Cognatazoarcus halotolerans]|uniref:shikimate kinase n=1 Tax=Cognatazoarcus halotolerans TaxID=2686016 RepID=UPI00135941E6|nr:shikimate kinase [Cognatazoarcus halotolerans]MBX3680322.1 shikimate kinase [Rhodocyclaceae bacterium]
MEPETPICLVGMMGAGKTTVGKDLAKRLGRRFVDVDHEIVARTGVQIPVIFEIEGEEGFRRRESQVLSELVATSGLVIATGGGIVLAEENRKLLREHAFVVLIEVSPEILWERTRHDRNRPLLQVENPRQRIRELHAQRAPLYREVAHLVMSGGRGSAHAMARNIERELRQSCER